MMKKLVLFFLFNYVLSDPRCPFTNCTSYYYPYGCDIFCQGSQFPDLGNQISKVNYLSFNGLTKIPSNAFKNLNINYLNIDCNNLNEVDYKAFDQVLSLNNLNLDKIRNISLFFTGVLDPLENLTRVLNIDRANLDNQKVYTILEDIKNWSVLSQLSISNSYLDNFAYDFNLNFKSLSNLYLQSNQIKKFFISSNKLLNLNLEDNMIDDIDLKSIPNLISLDISSNKIENFQFRNRINLKFLDLSYNNLKVLTNQTFENLTTLESLYLNDCSISQIEAGTFCNLNKLKLLSLSQNDLSLVKLYCLNKIYNLQLASVNYSGIMTQEDIGDPKAVQQLYLSNNKIESLELKNLSNIWFLFLNNNNLKSLSNDTIKAISSVYYIELSNNKLEDLGILEWRKVKFIYLMNNNLKEIRSQSLEQASELDTLHAPYNLIETVRFPDLPKLKLIDLTKNKLSEIKKFTFMSLKSLVQLYLGHNLISKIETKSFDKNKFLEILFLNDNMLTTTPDISKLSVLNYLNLNNNRISSLANNAFERNTSEADIAKSKIRIDLNGNNITKISSKTFCSQYSYSLGILGVEIRFDDLNSIDVCQLKQFNSDDTKIYSRKKINCDLKKFSQFHNISLLDNFSNSCISNVTYNECQNETLFNCPNNREIVRFTSWITGDPHVFSYKNKYELCTLGKDAVCFQNDDFILLCTDEQFGKTNLSATVLTELKFIYTLSNQTNITFIATKDNFPKVFSNNNDKIFANESNNDQNLLVELIKYPDMRIIFINESKTHIFITKYGSFYSVVLRATHQSYSESSGVLYEGCKNEMKNVMRRKRNIDTYNCSMECSNFSLSIDDENMPEDVLRDACNYDCENGGQEAIGWLKKTDQVLNLIDRSDSSRLESLVLNDTTTQITHSHIISQSNKIHNSNLCFSVIFFIFFY